MNNKKSQIPNPKSQILYYGKSSVEPALDSGRFEVLGAAGAEKPLSDAEIGARLDAPVGSPAIEEIVGAGASVLIVVPDATRPAASGQIVNLLVRRLIASGVMPYDIRIIFATGIHRKATDAEKQEIVTPFIAQRIKLLDHDPRDLVRLVRLGTTVHGIPVELNRALVEHDHTIIVGGITFHYFAGFTGGRKLICPGLASSRTVSATHKLAFDCDRKTRRAGVGTGKLEGNPVHQAFAGIVEQRPPSFAVNTIVNQRGETVAVFAGDWQASHRAGCAAYAAQHTIRIKEKRGLVIVSCGGFPHDINLIQAHKALEAAAAACTDGGTIIFLAECADGPGRRDFLNWFDAGTSAELAERLCQSYQVNGQTAWSLLKKAERFDIRMMTALAADDLRRMHIKKAADLETALAGTDPEMKGYILPFGAKYLITGEE